VFEYRTILATTDFSDPSAAAVEHAVSMAERLGGRLILAYVVEDRLPPVVLAASSEPEERILERHARTAEHNLGVFVRQRFPDAEFETEVLMGTPHAAIVEFATENGVDLIVIGTRGHGLLGHALLGSTAERVVHHAPCPVLVVRSGD